MGTKQMVSFDQLPRDVRRVLRDLPFNINAEHALKIMRTPGFDKVRAERKLRDFCINKYRDEELDPEKFIAPGQLNHKDNWI